MYVIIITVTMKLRNQGLLLVEFIGLGLWWLAPH